MALQELLDRKFSTSWHMDVCVAEVIGIEWVDYIYSQPWIIRFTHGLMYGESCLYGMGVDYIPNNR